MHLAHPSGLNGGQRRRKDDEHDATDLAGMLRLGRLPEAWIAPLKDLVPALKPGGRLSCTLAGRSSTESPT